MLKKFINDVGIINILMLFVVLSIIVVAEFVFMQGRKLDAIFIGLWAPTILGFMNYFKYRK